MIMWLYICLCFAGMFTISLVCLSQAVKRDLSEVFAAHLSFATELEDQSKVLVEKLEQASSLHSHYGDEVQSKYLWFWQQQC